MKRLRFRFLLFFFITGILFSQQSEVVFLQMNDVYEIAPIEGGKFGGLSRVATIKQNLMKENPYTYLVLSGDFISPSALSTSTFENEKINGRQMIDVLNHIGLDFVTFGNHEFDYKFDILQKRINESKFEWIVNNTFFNNTGVKSNFYKYSGDTPAKVPEYIILVLPGYIKNQKIRIGITAVCTNNNKQPFVEYDGWNESTKQVYNLIKDSIDCFIALTHLAIDDDRKLAAEVPQLSLIMGGHEHLNNIEQVGNTVIAKADANARTVYIHKLIFDMHNKLIKIDSKLVTVDASIPENADVKSVVELWVNRAFAGFKSIGFDPSLLVATVPEPLDGIDESTRFKQTNLGELIAEAMLAASPVSELAFFNSGSIRLDDKLNGEVTQYDIIRTLPFGGKIIDIELKGSLLTKMLEAGRNNKGSGGYLQYCKVRFDDASNKWYFGDSQIDPERTYKAAVAAYLLTGLEANMSFFTKDNSEITKITEPDAADKNDLRNDVRLAIISYMQKIYK